MISEYGTECLPKSVFHPKVREIGSFWPSLSVTGVKVGATTTGGRDFGSCVG